MSDNYYGKKVVLYLCEDKTGRQALVLATSPEQAKKLLLKEHGMEFITASMMGAYNPKPTVLFIGPEPAKTRIQQLWDEMNESERHGVRFGMFPAKLGSLSREEVIGLMKIAGADKL